jgi:iron complex outermembrane receptor protein
MRAAALPARPAQCQGTFMTVRSSVSRARALLLAGAIGISLQAPAHAQAVPPPQDTADAGDIVVTATRRPEPLQTVPVAVSVIDGDVLRRANLNSMRDIASQIPSLSYRTAASAKDQTLIVRGIGTISTSPGVEPSTSTVIDGVVLGRQGQAAVELLDIDHIEVLRGPQGTLFGKNASAGVVNIVSRTPGDDLHGFVDGAYYSGGGEYRARAGISGALVQGKAAAGLTAMYSRYDGNVTNVFNGDTVNGFERYGVRGKLALTPSDDVKIMLIADYSHSTDTTPQGVVAQTSLRAYPSNALTNYPAFAAALAPVVASRANRAINSNYDTHATDDNYGVSGQIDWSIGTHTLTAITAWRRWENTQFQDQDRLPAPIVGFPQQHDRGDLAYEQVSQELRLASPKGGFVDYVAGLFYFRGQDKEGYRRDTTIASAASSVTHTGIADFGVTNSSYAAFGEANLHFTSRLRALGGLRVVHDDVDYHFTRVQTAFSSQGSTGTTDVAGRAGLQFDLAPRIMAYATYSRGYKGPGYNLAFSMLPQDTGTLKAETSNAFEAGVKSRLFGGAVLLNVDAFLDKLDNFQVPFFDVSTRGVEADLTARLSRAFTLNGALAYTDARVDRFICPAGTSASCAINGKTLPFAPKWRGNVRATYRLPVAQRFDLILGSDVNWQSKVQYSLNQTPDTVEGGYAIWNATIGVASHDGFELNFVVKNIADRNYSSYLQTFGSGLVRFVPRDAQRYFGANLHKAF